MSKPWVCAVVDVTASFDFIDYWERPQRAYLATFMTTCQSSRTFISALTPRFFSPQSSLHVMLNADRAIGSRQLYRFGYRASHRLRSTSSVCSSLTQHTAWPTCIIMSGIIGIRWHRHVTLRISVMSLCIASWSYIIFQWLLNRFEIHRKDQFDNWPSYSKNIRKDSAQTTQNTRKR